MRRPSTHELVALIGGASVLLSSCSTYRVVPLDETALLAELRATRIEFPADGLDPVQAVALALVHNPALVALRREHEIAENVVLAEGAWRNPELRLNLTNLASTLSNPVALALGLRIFPPVPGEGDARVARARALDERVVAEIADREAHLAAETKIAHADVVALEEELALVQIGRKLHERIASMVSERVAAQAATRLDESLAILRREEIENEIHAVAGKLDVARAEFASLVGAAPDATIQVKKAMSESELSMPKEAELEQAALERRADLQALKHQYEAQQQSLRLAHLAHGLWPTFLQPEAEADHLGRSLGVQAAFEIPIFDTGKAAIALEEARARQARELYSARLHEVRREIHLAALELREEARRQRYQSDRMQPVLEQTEQLMQAALEAGEVDALKLVTIETRLLDARRGAVRAWLDLERARVTYELATGTVFGTR